MVAARSANQAPDVAVTSELGSLLHAHVQIKDPRWRLDAIARLVPTLRRFGVSIARLRHEVGVLVSRAVCPRPLRDVVGAALVGALETGSANALARLASSLFMGSWQGALLRSVSAALALGDRPLAETLANRFARRNVSSQVELLLARGFLTGEAFAACLDRRGAEEAFAPSLPLFVALVDVSEKQAERAGDAERLLQRLRRQDQPIAIAHLARLEPTLIAAKARLRSIKHTSTRQLGGLLLARQAIARGRLDEARSWAAWIEKQIARQRVHLEIARALWERGEPSQSLRALKHAVHRDLWSEQLLLRSEIRLLSHKGVLRMTDEPAWTGPSWTHRCSPVEPRARRAIIVGVGLLRWLRLDDDGGWVVNDALASFGRHITHRAFAANFLRRAKVDLETALMHLSNSRRDHIIDALVAEQVAQRASSLDRVAALSAGAAVEDPRTLERALFDESVALSGVAQRRRVLIAAAQHCLRSALAAPTTWDARVVETRLRTLAHLGGELGTQAIRKAVETQPVGVFTTTAIETLCTLDPARAAEIAITRGAELATARIDVVDVLQVAEVHHGVPRGFSLAYRSARTALRERSMCRDAESWLAQLVREWRRRYARLPDPILLSGIGERKRVPRSPSAIFEELDGATAALATHSHFETFDRLCKQEGLLDAALIAAPARRDPSVARDWSPKAWRDHLEILHRDHDGLTVCMETLRRVARALRQSHAIDDLRRGNLAALGVAPICEIAAEGNSYRLRLFDKCIDILTYLRFADVPARSCYRSDSEHWFWSADAVANVWRDPLSVCFHVERATRAAWEPCGFLFGGFVELRDELGVAFNSLHVRPNRAAVREGAIAAVERMFCKPLGIRMVGIANCHGGRGPLPAGYEQRTMKLKRFRALRLDGALVKDARDDISALNAPVSTPRLWWRELE